MHSTYVDLRWLIVQLNQVDILVTLVVHTLLQQHWIPHIVDNIVGKYTPILPLDGIVFVQHYDVHLVLDILNPDWRVVQHRVEHGQSDLHVVHVRQQQQVVLERCVGVRVLQFEHAVRHLVEEDRVRDGVEVELLVRAVDEVVHH